MTARDLCKTLIVDDELLIREGIKHYIDWEQEGFQIVGEAANGQEALELIELVRPHIIITDIVMPIMDGEELTKIVKRKYPEIEIIILSSFGEFDYVRSTFQSGVVDYILKPKLNANSLIGVLRAAASRIPFLKKVETNRTINLPIEQIVHKMISGYQVHYDPATIANRFPCSEYCLLGIDLQCSSEKANPDFQEQLKRDFETDFHNHFNEAFQYLVLNNQNKIIYFVNINQDDSRKFINFVKKFSSTKIKIGCALTELFDDFSQISKEYKDHLEKLLNYRFYLPDKPLLMKRDLPKPPHKCDNFDLDWFTGEFKRKHFDSAFSYLMEHVNKLSKCYTTDIYEYKAFFGNIIFNITVLLGNLHYNVTDLEEAKYTFFKSIEESWSATEAIENLQQFIDKAKHCLASAQKTQAENPNLKKIMEYIMDNYAKPLTLTNVANHFHFNPSYLSSYFSTHSQEGFIEYLNKIRIKEAAKLLAEDPTPISEIGAMVGYSDHSYFCKVFKKTTGLSPSQYRRNYNVR